MAAESSTVDKRKSIGTENRKSSSSKSNSVYGKRLSIGDVFPIALLKTIDGVEVPLIGGKGLIYLQLRRFSGCPLCKLNGRQAILTLILKKMGFKAISSFLKCQNFQKSWQTKEFRQLL